MTDDEFDDLYRRAFDSAIAPCNVEAALQELMARIEAEEKPHP